ncbi:dynamin family protein [Hydrogenimonas sp.]
MLKQKVVFLDYIDEVGKLLGKNFVSMEEMERLEKRIERAELVVPVVGGFSTGKSTLVNSFLGADILPTNLTPETALATELRYSATDFMEAVKEDGSSDRYETNRYETLKEMADEYEYVRLHLNNAALEAIEPLVLVDMPGFDSPLDLHNRAILNYLERGVHFVVLVGVEEGGVTRSLLRELENMVEFGKDFSFCLSKTNLKPSDEIVELKRRIEEQLADEFDFEKEVVLLDDDGGRNLERILKDIDTEELFRSLFIDELKACHFQIDSEISTKIATLKASKNEALEAMASLKEGIEKIVAKKERMIAEARERYADKNSESIVNAVADELLKNREYLLSLAIQSQESFRNEVNAIVKNRLVYELNRTIGDIGSDIVDNFAYEMKIVGTETGDFAIDDKWVEAITSGSRTLLESTRTGMEKLLEHTRGKSGTLYKIITTTLGLTTTVLSPVLEVVVIFLPEIVGFFTEKTQERRQKEVLMQKFQTQIVPSLKVKLRGVVQTTMQEQIERLITDIGERFEARIRQKEREIAESLEEKERTVAESEERIEALRALRSQLRTLTTRKLLQGDRDGE